MTIKICRMCEQTKSLVDFSIDNDTKDGHSSACKLCAATYQRQYYRNNVETQGEKIRSRRKVRRLRGRQYVYDYLSTHPCELCGYDKVPALQFDHLRDKTASISDMPHKGSSIKAIEAEITKCRVLCANCHFEHTARQRNWYQELNV